MATTQEELARAQARLREAGGSSPDLDAAVLLGHVLGVSRASLYTHPERQLSEAEQARYSQLIERRALGEPVAYLTGHREFMGLDFLVDRRVLIPRPETESLVEAALAEVQRREETLLPSLRVADIGTGSGAIAIALAAHEPRLPLIYATDLSADALLLAEENARRLQVAGRVRFLQGDLLEPLPEPVDLLLANLPYVAPGEAEILPIDVREYEPHLALFGQDDGLGHIQRLLASAPPLLKPGALVLLEFGYQQREALEQMIPALLPGTQARFLSDYAGWDRVVALSRIAR
jgi:release factor glutamine methyltransferase